MKKNSKKFHKSHWNTSDSQQAFNQTFTEDKDESMNLVHPDHGIMVRKTFH